MEDNKNSESQTPVTTNNGSLVKDLMIPISIVIAGIFIGGGLYFGGAPAAKSPTSDNVVAAQPQKLTVPQLVEKAGVDLDDFNNCVREGTYRSNVQDDINNAVETGGKGTPWSIVIGPGGKTYALNGALPQATVEQTIQLALSEAEQGPESSANPDTNKVTPVTAEDHIKGNVDAKVKVIEYSDFDCPFCSRFHDTMNSVSAKYDDSEVAWVYRHFPLEQLHPNAPVIALASECVAALGDSDSFWAFADGYLSQ